jgi:hypothetical protein
MSAPVPHRPEEECANSSTSAICIPLNGRAGPRVGTTCTSDTATAGCASESCPITTVRRQRRVLETGYGDLGDGYLSFRSLRKRTRGVVDWPKRTSRPGLTL